MRVILPITRPPILQTFIPSKPKTKKYHRPTWGISMGVMVILTTLGFGMVRSGRLLGDDHLPYPFPIATQSETSFSSPPFPSFSNSSKARPLTQGFHRHREALDQPGHQDHQPRDSPEPDQVPAAPSSESPVFPKKPIRTRAERVVKAPMTHSPGHKGRGVANPAPRIPIPQDDTERLRRGSSLVRKHLYRQAIDMLRPVFAQPPEGWSPWFWMGTAYLGLGHYEEARGYFREGLARDGTIPELWVQCAVAEHQRGRFSQALTLLRQAELLAPALPHVHLNLAFTLERQGYTTLALQHYRIYLSVTDRNSSHFSTRRKVIDRILNLEGS